MFTPSTACLVQSNLGATKAAAFDLNAACTGFIYAVGIASQFIKTGQSKNALVIGAEVLSKIIDWEDRSTCVLFGDGAGAVVLERSEEIGLISQYTGSDGSGGKFLECGTVPLKNPYSKTDINFKSNLSMEGREVFKFAINAMIHSIGKVLKDTQYTLDDIDYIVPHQANLRIIDFVAKKLKLDKDKFYINLDRYGNTSGASIPIALDEMNEKGLLKSGMFARVNLMVALHTEAVTVPEDAVVAYDGTKIVYTLEGDVAKANTVETGPTSMGKTVITKGLEPGKEIIVEGHDLVTDGMKVKVEGRGDTK